jgi:putative FmdB family regulatory protein
MPLYEYRCDACGDVIEVKQKFSDVPLSVHEGCGGKLARMLSAPAFQFKGTGWYVTDYGRKSGGGSNGGSTKAHASESKAVPKSDTNGKPKTDSGKTV